MFGALGLVWKVRRVTVMVSVAECVDAKQFTALLLQRSCELRR